MGKLLPQNQDLPWLCILEFQSFNDADAARQLIAEQGLGEAIVRKKLKYAKQGAFQHWRSTVAMRNAFSNRTFDSAMLASEMIKNGWSGTRPSVYAWLSKALEAKVAERIRHGEYRFLPPTHADLPQAGQCGSVPYDLACVDCQPERLQCEAL